MNNLSAATGRACLVESIPKGLEDLRGTPGVQYTEDVLVRMTRAAQTTIDLTAMYWALLARSNERRREGFHRRAIRHRWALGPDARFTSALQRRSERGVTIRILQSPGLLRPEAGVRDTTSISSPTASRSIRSRWATGTAAAASCTRRSGSSMPPHLPRLCQHGLEVDRAGKGDGRRRRGLPGPCRRRRQVLRGVVAFRPLTPASVEVFDPAARIDRRVPPWSALAPPAQARRSPLADDEYAPPSTAGARCQRRIERRAGRLFLTGCPDEVLRLRAAPGTATDWSTPSTTRARSICVSVMDFGPVGLYSRQNAGPPVGDEGVIPNDTPVWWPSLFDALLSAVLTRKVYVRLLVSKWAHTSGPHRALPGRVAEGRRCRPRGPLHDCRPARDQAVHHSRLGQHRPAVAASIPATPGSITRSTSSPIAASTSARRT